MKAYFYFIRLYIAAYVVASVAAVTGDWWLYVSLLWGIGVEGDTLHILLNWNTKGTLDYVTSSYLQLILHFLSFYTATTTYTTSYSLILPLHFPYFLPVGYNNTTRV